MRHMSLLGFLHRIQHSSKMHSIKTYFWDLIVNDIVAAYILPSSIRRLVMNLLGCKINGTIHGHCYIASSKLIIGKRSYINRNCCLDNANANIIIGDGCAIAFNTTILTTNHIYDNPQKRSGRVVGSPVIIEDGSWIGANSVFVIAAGSVVRGMCEANCLYAGVPAVIIKRFIN